MYLWTGILRHVVIGPSEQMPIRLMYILIIYQFCVFLI